MQCGGRVFVCRLVCFSMVVSLTVTEVVDHQTRSRAILMSSGYFSHVNCFVRAIIAGRVDVSRLDRLCRRADARQRILE